MVDSYFRDKLKPFNRKLWVLSSKLTPSLIMLSGRQEQSQSVINQKSNLNAVSKIVNLPCIFDQHVEVSMNRESVNYITSYNLCLSTNYDEPLKLAESAVCRNHIDY